jgi:hypothetical protein
MSSSKPFPKLAIIQLPYQMAIKVAKAVKAGSEKMEPVLQSARTCAA